MTQSPNSGQHYYFMYNKVAAYIYMDHVNKKIGRMPGDADDFGIPQQNSTFSENPREGILKKYATQNGPCLVQAFLGFDDVNF